MCKNNCTFYDVQVDYSDNTTFTGNDLCPVGYYCTNGTAYPIPCPIGTFSTQREIMSPDGCEPCPKGRYCNVQAFTKVTSAPLCSAGQVLKNVWWCFVTIWSTSSKSYFGIPIIIFLKNYYIVISASSIIGCFCLDLAVALKLTSEVFVSQVCVHWR